MNRLRTLALAALTAPCLLAGCASNSAGQPGAAYDFGPALPLTQTAAAPPLAALMVADLSGPAALDSERMVYRLLYADPRQARPYAYHQWTSSPLQLLTQRLKTRFAQAGVKILSSSDGAAGLPLLRIEVDDFAQHFDSASHSTGQLALRASLFQGHLLLDQRSFQRSSPAPTPDAAGGARALADSSDALAADLLSWLATLPPERRPK